MRDYIAKLKDDLLEQFRGKPHIEALAEVVGAELQEIADFYEQLLTERDVMTAVGKQLDGVGDIAVLSRMEAAQLAGDPIPFDVIDDETYRHYLIYKILKNNCDCTYPDIIRAFRMFWDRPLYYKEDPQYPATMIFDTGEMEGLVDTSPLFRTPLLRAAGVTLKLYARTRTEMPTDVIGITGALGYAMTETNLPFLERDIDYGTEIRIHSGFQRITEDTLPELEREYKLGYKVCLGSNFHSVATSNIPATKQGSGNPVVNVMETPISGYGFR